jgi:Nuclease-related domain
MLAGNIPFWAAYAFDAYFIAFMVITGGIFWWSTARKKDRPPEDFKLLRGPGETQRRRVQKADENLFFYFFGGAFGPLVIVSLVLLLAVQLPKRLVLLGAMVAAVLFVASTVFAIIMLLRFLNRRRNDLLGYLGERAVAEHLEELRETGYRIFHDVPCEGRKKNFNIDHVVVGKTGVAAIEVKTRRKKKGRPGFEEHVVTYDGQRLTWPWGEDRCGIDQLLSESDWLRKFIYDRTGLRVDPKSILALPGWWVTERVVGTFRVASHKVVPTIIRDWRPQPLTPEQIDLISRQLDERCRDVED